jgi:hypothetical protein
LKGRQKDIVFKQHKVTAEAVPKEEQEKTLSSKVMKGWRCPFERQDTKRHLI